MRRLAMPSVAAPLAKTVTALLLVLLSGLTITVESRDGDEGEPFRGLDPTNEEGRTRRALDVRHEKGTVELQIEAVAPHGGEGRAVVTYFRR
jgi:hypothetical protein